MKYDDVKKIYNEEPLIIEKDLSNPGRPKQRPKKSTLKIVLDVISSYKNIRRNLIVKNSELSGHAVDRSIDTLLEDGLITRKKIGKAGGYDVYTYSAVK